MSAEKPDYDEMLRYRDAGRNYKASLVQRLIPRHSSGVSNPFSFGGGLVNGGLSDRAMSMLPFAFDYMGSAQYEWGAVPACLSAMAENANKLVQATIKVSLGDIIGYYPWEMEDALREAKNDAAACQRIREEWAGDLVKDGEVEVYIIAHQDFLSDVEADIREMIGLPAGQDRLRDGLQFEHVVFDAKNDYKRKVCGWLALTRAFFFAVDAEMFAQTWEMFQQFATQKA